MICSDCVKHPSLKKLVSEKGMLGVCVYCEVAGNATDIDFVLQYIYERVRENVASEDDLSDFEYWMLYEGGAEDIGITTWDEIFEDWLDLQDEVFYDKLCDGVPHEFKINSQGEQTHLYEDGGFLEFNFYEAKWARFVDDIRHEHRFFNPNARGFLDAVFGFLVDGEGSLKPEVIRMISRGTELFRARTAHSYGDAQKIAADPASQFGPTPKITASSQRMTPSGISALYCALERETCLSEIRSITGDDVISVGLTPTTTLKLLDLTKLENVEPPRLNLLDVGYRDALHLKTFLRSLVKKMSKPKGRNDELNYLSTQVVFEYLRLRFSKQVDGLVFPSVQTGNKGTNVVLFPEASSVSGQQHTATGEAAVNLEPGKKLAVVCGSLRFHKIKAIKTEATTYQRLEDFYMSDEVRNRLGIRAPKPD